MKVKNWTILYLRGSFHDKMIKTKAARAVTVFVGIIEASEKSVGSIATIKIVGIFEASVTEELKYTGRVIISACVLHICAFFSAQRMNYCRSLCAHVWTCSVLLLLHDDAAESYRRS